MPFSIFAKAPSRTRVCWHENDSSNQERVKFALIFKTFSFCFFKCASLVYLILATPLRMGLESLGSVSLVWQDPCFCPSSLPYCLYNLKKVPNLF